ncbi:MAG: hypothetical protein VW600_01150, partial [Ferrovibrio sp.]
MLDQIVDLEHRRGRGAVLRLASQQATMWPGTGSVSGGASARPFSDKARPIKAVVVGGSISMYYAGNYGQFLEHGCKTLEVVNKA